MSSTTTLRSDTARTGTNPNFPINTNPWRKYLSVDLGTTSIGGQTVTRAVRAGILVVENWLFGSGPHQGETHTLVLVATTTNEIYCYGEGSLLANGNAATSLWQTTLGVPRSCEAAATLHLLSASAVHQWRMRRTGACL
jgi:hypothetical protein